jgi:tetratricopeptide (TPR) repeat protein
MVRKYVQDYKESYDIIAFLDANVDLASQFILLAKEINQQICLTEGCYVAENPKNVKKSLMEFLKARDKWLLIFDNLHINENAKIRDFINWQHNGHIVICSQDDKYLLAKIQVPYLTEANARIIINKIIKNPSKEFVQELSSILQGYPPYMIGHSAIFLQNNNFITIKEYIKYMKQNDDKVRAHLNVILNNMQLKTKEMLFKIILLNNQKISRSLLEKLFSDDRELSNSIQEIIRFGLIEQISEDRNNQTFRMHDAVKSELLDIASNITNKQNIDIILNRVNLVIPEIVTDRVAFIKADSSLESNLEILLKNADEYEADIYQIIQLRDKLSWYYCIGVREPHNAKKMVDWYESHKQKINLWLCSDREKAAYAEYLTYIGIYYYATELDYVKGLEYLNLAQGSLGKFADYEEVKSYVYAITAQMQITLGNIKQAENNIQRAKRIRPVTPKIFLGVGLIEYQKSLIFLAQGKYEEALSMLLVDIEKSPIIGLKKSSENRVFLHPEYITQVSILNYMKRYKEAYNIIVNIYHHLKNKNKGEVSTVVLSRTLTELSRAELGLGKRDIAFTHAEEAVDVLVKDEERNNKDDIDNSKDILLGLAIAAKANALDALGNAEKAIKNYKLAKNIYWNIYGTKNLGNIDNVSYLFANAAKAACNLPNQMDAKIECGYFYKLLVKFFGVDHPRSIEIDRICG